MMRLLASLPLSVALCPIVTYWTGLGGGALFGGDQRVPVAAGTWAPVFAIYGMCFLVWLALLSGRWGHESPRQWMRGFRAVPHIGWVIAGVWFLVAVASLVDLQIHDRLYLSFSDGVTTHCTRR